MRSMPSNVYLYYPVKKDLLSCIICGYPYALDAPLSTLKKHLRVKHGVSIRNPPTQEQAEGAKQLFPEHTHTRICIQSLLNDTPDACQAFPEVSETESTHSLAESGHSRHENKLPSLYLVSLASPY